MSNLSKRLKIAGTSRASRLVRLAAVVVLAVTCGRSDSSVLLGPVVNPLDQAVVQLAPQAVTLSSGGSYQFEAVAILPDNSQIVPDVIWTAMGGTISATGLFTAGTAPGTYQVSAQIRNHRRSGSAPVTVAPVTLTVLSLSPSTVTLVSGAIQQFTVAGVWSDGTTSAPAVTYSAAGGAITATGLYTAGATPGTFRVIVSQQGGTKVDTAVVTITALPPTLTQMVLGPASLSLAVGATGQFSVTGTWSDGTTTSPAVTYAATGGTITSTGLYTAGTTAGTFRVIATQQGGTKVDTAAVTITALLATLSQMVLSPSVLSLATGATGQFSVTGTWSDGTTTAPAVTYSATGGTISVTGLYTAGTTAGTYRVIATQQGGTKVDTAAVTITAAPPTLTQMILSPASLSLAVGTTSQFGVTGTWSDGTTTAPSVTYSATGGTITTAGLYTAGMTAGTFRVIATQQGGTKVDTAAVTITAVPPTLTQMVLSPASISLAAGATGQFAVTGTWSDGTTIVPLVTYTATGGTITANGLFTAGATAGTFRVIATQKGGNKVDTSLVTIAPAVPSLIKVTISPKTLAIGAGASQQFAVSGTWSDGTTSAPAVAFSAFGGTISATGLYTAGSTSGSFQVIATQVIGGKADTSLVTVSANVSTFVRPFSNQSPWNSPVSAYQSASYVPTSAFTGFLAAMSSWPGALWVSMWQASATDPVVNLYYNPNAWINVANGLWKRSGNSPAVEATIRQGMDQQWGGYEANMYSTTTPNASALPATFHARESTYWSLIPHVPAGVLPPPDADGHMTIFQPNGWALEILAPIVLANGDIVCMFASYTDPTGLGAGDENGRRATMIPNYAGIIRNGELSSGHIDHALSIAVGGEALTTSVVWPAVTMDRTTSNYSGSIPMGAFLSIPAAVDVTRLGLQTPEGVTIARAAQSYGAYVTDQSGPRYLLITSETNAPDIPAWSGPLGADLQVIMAQLKLTALGSHK